jgi:hypothetical protein
MRTPLAVLIAAASLLSAADFKDFKKTVPLDANGRFTLDTFKGSIHISAWDQPQASIEARIEVDPGWFYEPVDDVEIRVDASPGSVRVKTDYRHHFSFFVEGNNPNVRYTIRVPRTVSLSIKDYKSDTDITGVQGDVEFNTFKGTARLDGLQRGLQAETYKGEIRASFVKFGAHSHIETYKGWIELSLPRSSAFEIHAQVSRRVSFDSDFARTVNSTRRDSEIRSVVNGGGPQLRITSYRGSIRLRAS